MTASRVKFALYIVPAIIVAVFETLRENYCVPYVSLTTGNWIIALLTAFVIALTTHTLFQRYEQTERALGMERETRAIMEERERLERDLHDRIAQSIFYLGVRTQTAKQKPGLTSADAIEFLDELVLTLREMDENVRQAIFNLRQDTETEPDFKERAERYLGNVFAGTGVDWDMEIDEEAVWLETAEQVQLFGILQEAATNVRKHARAHRVQVKLSVDGQEKKRGWVFSIQDDGEGFDPTQVPAGRFGLTIMRSRAHDIGANVDIKPNEKGTLIRVTRLPPKVP